MTKNNYKVIVFDLGDVLLNVDSQRLIDKLNNVEAGLGDRFHLLYFENYHIHCEYEKNNISREEFTDKMLSWLNFKISAEEFFNFYSDLFSPIDETINLLPLLKQKYQLVLLSNTNFIHHKYGWEKYEFLKYFDKMILSHEVGFRKPEKKIYEAVENFTGSYPFEHFFIDDLLENVEAAKSLGWDAAQYLKNDSFTYLLKEWKII